MRAEARVAVALLLQHHPLCKEFASDRITLGRLRLCSGCVAAVPAAFLGLVAGGWLVLQDRPAAAVVAAGLVLGTLQLTTYVHRGSRTWRFAAKGIAGLGLGLVLGSFWLLPFPVAWLWAGLAALGATFVGLQGVRVRAILRTCDACPYRRDWGACPGFQATARPGHATAASWEAPSSSQAP